MNQHLQTIFNFIQQSEHLNAEEKTALLKASKDADKELEITAFKLDRTEKVKRTTAILLEETIEELEQKRKAVESQNRELEIESSLERVRTVAMGMNKPDDMLNVCRKISDQLEQLGFKQVRNVQTVIIYEQKQEYLNYQYFTPYDENSIETIDYRLHPDVLEFTKKMLQSADAYYTKTFEGEELNVWRLYRKQTNQLPDPKLDETTSSHYYFYSIGSGALGVTTYAPLHEEEISLFKRFRNVFQLAYSRFIDIQKAEAQAREAQIELALERVRARTMAMHKSEELAETAEVLYHQLKDLGDNPERITIGILNQNNGIITWWATDQGGSQLNFRFEATIDEPTVMLKLYNSWKAKDKSLAIDLTGKELFDWVKYCREVIGVPIKEELLKNRRVQTAGFFSHGWVMITSPEPPSVETVNLLERFAAVFNLTYTRFLDLQKAEANARESKIEASLERVRAKAMGMHSSQDLADTIAVFYHEVDSFSITPRRCGVGLLDKETHVAEISTMNTTEQGTSIEVIGRLKMVGHPVLEGIFENWLLQKEYHPVLRGAEIKEYYQLIRPQIPFPDYPTDVVQYGYFFFFTEGGVYAWTDKELGEEELKIYRRFTSVLSLTYKRYKDLKEAEAQAREAQIELGLERVRAKAMAMQNSNELAELVDTVFKELTKLDFALTRCLIWIFDADACGATIWSANSETDKTPHSFYLNFLAHPFPVHKAMIREWKKRSPRFFYELKGEEKKSMDNFLINETELSQLPEEVKAGMIKSERVVLNSSFSNFGSLQADSLEPLSDDKREILYRFAKVFDLTYTRFNDLQKAEAAAREAKIEASLERVRSKTMAMHNSQDVADTVATMFDELVKLGVETYRCGIGIMHDTKPMELWTAKPGADGKADLVIGSIDMTIHPLFQGALNGWKNKEESFSYDLKGNDLINYYNSLNSQPGYPVNYDLSSLPPQLFHNDYYFYEGTLFVFSLEQLSAETSQIFKRFAGLFGQTYRRYLDLQKAEAQAREAKIEAALERVRSRTLAMQKSDELAEAAAVLFKQLILLGIEPNRLYINIIKNETGDAEFWITDEDGSKVSSAFESNMNDNPSFKKMYKGWKQKKKSLMIDMKGKELSAYFQYLSSLHVPFKDGLTQKRRLQYIAYFNKGFIGMASPDEQPEATVFLLERFAAVFNLTFTRFNDLKIAEAHAIQAEEDLIKLQTEKRRAEDALAELQVTQKQLIQSEKMASLGELTAGIAHEIQNPLNFVNNFSEVNSELIDEMNAEIEKGDMEEAKAIANDIKQNLEKINHHGKRADAIVKGMLQHSRTSSVIKEPTDINKLADEYLRLAYHGLRAKDKSFNATMKTDYDESIGNINIIPQDIGRVILNLITNAFYAASLPSKGGFKDPAYKHEPTVWVKTSRIPPSGGRGAVLISVRDNGPGIPQKVLDKIFQPFFTTKPTGQGTGLGLSLAYDIVKAHGGQLKVKTKEGEYAEFIIQLPYT